MRKTTINIFIINQLFSCGHHTIPTALQLTAELTEIIKLKNGSDQLGYNVKKLTEAQKEFFRYQKILVTNKFFSVTPSSLPENTEPSSFKVTIPADSHPRQMIIEITFTKNE